MKTLKDLFIGELQDMYDAEHRITKALPKMAKAATSSKLKGALEKHLKETEGQITKLEQAFKSIGEKAKAKECKATVGLLKEGDELAGEFKGSPAIDAAIVSACQKVEHYEIASYGCLYAWAKLLGFTRAGELISQILAQEKAADAKLNELAKTTENKEALGNGNAHWWSDKHESAWDKVSKAFKRDWAQTKHDFGGDEPETNQGVTDTVKQAAGSEAIPPRGKPIYAEDEPAYRFGYGARSHYGGKHSKWNREVEGKLKKDWLAANPARHSHWNADAKRIRSGWDYKQ